LNFSQCWIVIGNPIWDQQNLQDLQTSWGVWAFGMKITLPRIHSPCWLHIKISRILWERQ